MAIFGVKGNKRISINEEQAIWNEDLDLEYGYLNEKKELCLT